MLCLSTRLDCRFLDHFYGVFIVIQTIRSGCKDLAKNAFFLCIIELAVDQKLAFAKIVGAGVEWIESLLRLAG